MQYLNADKCIPGKQLMAFKIMQLRRHIWDIMNTITLTLKWLFNHKLNIILHIDFRKKMTKLNFSV